jgi:hypothetical protein
LVNSHVPIFMAPHIRTPRLQVHPGYGRKNALHGGAFFGPVIFQPWGVIPNILRACALWGTK